VSSFSARARLRDLIPEQGDSDTPDDSDVFHSSDVIHDSGITGDGLGGDPAAVDDAEVEDTVVGDATVGDATGSADGSDLADELAVGLDGPIDDSTLADEPDSGEEPGQPEIPDSGIADDLDVIDKPGDSDERDHFAWWDKSGEDIESTAPNFFGETDNTDARMDFSGWGGSGWPDNSVSRDDFETADDSGKRGETRARLTLVAAVLGFFIVALDASIVNIALPAMRGSLGGGMAGSQWVVDGYTLMFAALLLSAGALTDRAGALRSFRIGLVVFALASAICGLTPNLELLVAARFVQGTSAALLMPSSMALVSHAYPEPARRVRAMAMWTMGGGLATLAGPLLGGLLTLASWRLIFFVNVPAVVVALALVTRRFAGPVAVAPAPAGRTPASFDWIGQLTAVVAMSGVTFAAIETGSQGFTAPAVLISFAIAIMALAGFFTSQARGKHPMMPPSLLKSRAVPVAAGVGFAFVVGYYGLPFVMSLYLQEVRGLSPLAAGAVFLPMMITGVIGIPFTARAAKRVGASLLITAGLGAMAIGLILLAVVPGAPVWVLAVVMIFAGLAGPTVTGPMTGLLLNAVPQHQAGTASGVYNTSRQVGGALAVAVFGAMLASRGTFLEGLRASLLIAALVGLAAAWACQTLAQVGRHRARRTTRVRRAARALFAVRVSRASRVAGAEVAGEEPVPAIRMRG
jgi:MFS transporter, DHA2 family, methylenomycin A resistance protein